MAGLEFKRVLYILLLSYIDCAILSPDVWTAKEEGIGMELNFCFYISFGITRMY